MYCRREGKLRVETGIGYGRGGGSMSNLIHGQSCGSAGEIPDVTPHNERFERYVARFTIAL
jgi:hypothetical protein